MANTTIKRRLTPIERVEYERRCAQLAEQHVRAYRALLSELGLALEYGAEPMKVSQADSRLNGQTEERAK